MSEIRSEGLDAPIEGGQAEPAAVQRNLTTFLAHQAQQLPADVVKAAVGYGVKKGFDKVFDRKPPDQGGSADTHDQPSASEDPG